MTIKEAEALSGVSSRNIRFYEKKGLLSPARNRENDYREYSEADIQQLKLIRALRMVDMPIEQILEISLGRITIPAAIASHRRLLVERNQHMQSAIHICEEWLQAGTDDPNALLQCADAPTVGPLFSDWCRDYLSTAKYNPLLVLIGLVPSAVGFLLVNPFVRASFYAPVLAYAISILYLFLWGVCGFIVTRKQDHPYKNVLFCHSIMLICALVLFAWEAFFQIVPYYIQSVAQNLILFPANTILCPLIGSENLFNVPPIITTSHAVVNFVQILLMATVFYLGGMTAKLKQYHKPK